MLETILSWFVSLAGELFEAITNVFLDSITTNMNMITSIFPGLALGYRVFQAIGIGLVVCIASFQLIKFFGGQLTESRDTPLQILLRAAIAGVLLYFGGHALELVIEISRIPFTRMADVNSVNFSNFTESLTTGIQSGSLTNVAIALSGPVVPAIVLILLILIGWNLLKLMVEVCERYLMIIVLTYVSPLIFSTYTSRTTSHIFQKYLSMFFGQAILLTLSVWMLKLVMSGFATVGAGQGILFKMMLVLAMCKIAQRTDTYMQQLGIGVATTGENLVDDVIVAARAVGSASKASKGEAGGAKNEVLGAGPDGTLSRFGGLFGGAITTARRASQGIRTGQDISEITGSLGRNFKEGTGWFGHGTITAMHDAATAAADGDMEGTKAGIKKAFGGLATATAVTVDPTGTVRRRTAMKQQSDPAYETARRAVSGGRMYYDKGEDQRYQNPRGGNRIRVATLEGASDEVRNMQKASGLSTQQFMEYSAVKNGVGGFQADTSGGIGLNANAQAAGLSIRGYDTGGMPYDVSSWQFNNGDPAPYVEGPDDRVGDFVASNYSEVMQSDAAQATLLSTAEHMSEMSAEQALFNPYIDLIGNDEIGDQLIKKGIGEQRITGQTGGRFENITVTTDEDGGRIISCDYVSPDALDDLDAPKRHFELMDQVSLDGSGISSTQRAKEGFTHQMVAVESAATGQKVFRRETVVTKETVKTETSGRAKSSDSTTASKTSAEGKSIFHRKVERSQGGAKKDKTLRQGKKKSDIGTKLGGPKKKKK